MLFNTLWSCSITVLTPLPQFIYIQSVSKFYLHFIWLSTDEEYKTANENLHWRNKIGRNEECKYSIKNSWTSFFLLKNTTHNNKQVSQYLYKPCYKYTEMQRLPSYPRFFASLKKILFCPVIVVCFYKHTQNPVYKFPQIPTYSRYFWNIPATPLQKTQATFVDYVWYVIYLNAAQFHRMHTLPVTGCPTVFSQHVCSIYSTLSTTIKLTELCPRSAR